MGEREGALFAVVRDGVKKRCARPPRQAHLIIPHYSPNGCFIMETLRTSALNQVKKQIN